MEDIVRKIYEAITDLEKRYSIEVEDSKEQQGEIATKIDEIKDFSMNDLDSLTSKSFYNKEAFDEITLPSNKVISLEQVLGLLNYLKTENNISNDNRMAFVEILNIAKTRIKYIIDELLEKLYKDDNSLKGEIKDKEVLINNINSLRKMLDEIGKKYVSSSTIDTLLTSIKDNNLDFDMEDLYSLVKYIVKENSELSLAQTKVETPKIVKPIEVPTVVKHNDEEMEIDRIIKEQEELDSSVDIEDPKYYKILEDISRNDILDVLHRCDDFVNAAYEKLENVNIPFSPRIRKILRAIEDYKKIKRDLFSAAIGYKTYMDDPQDEITYLNKLENAYQEVFALGSSMLIPFSLRMIDFELEEAKRETVVNSRQDLIDALLFFRDKKVIPYFLKGDDGKTAVDDIESESSFDTYGGLLKNIDYALDSGQYGGGPLIGTKMEESKKKEFSFRIIPSGTAEFLIGKKRIDDSILRFLNIQDCNHLLLLLCAVPNKVSKERKNDEIDSKLRINSEDTKYYLDLFTTNLDSLPEEERARKQEEIMNFICSSYKEYIAIKEKDKNKNR